METSNLLDNLNEAQRQAITAPPCNQLILAGAGSGKTRVLVHRIAWLVQAEHFYPSSILAVTFTNKASKEMLNRIETLLGTPARGMWVSTFHALAHKLLRMHWREAELVENFQIMDSQDQYRLIRRVIRELNLDESQWQPKKIQWFINGQKDEGLRPHMIETHSDLYLKTMVRIYEAYETACAQASVLDFAELLLRAFELWNKKPELLAHYQTRFKHILVDEFQDTNAIQYGWLKLLMNSNNHITIVGDDDQSIYGWRGARIENIHQAQRDFPDMQLIRLEQNYRSTNVILGAANALINHNNDRLGKNLWSASDRGEAIILYQAFNELDEARYIMGLIRQWLQDGNRRDEIAILYRSNAQSRVLEEALIEACIPYRIYGGLRFFERQEVKDALAYLRLMNSHQDDTAFERIVNTPTRGIGDATMSILRDYSRKQKVSLWQAAEINLDKEILNVRAKNALKNFLDLITTMAADTSNIALELQTQHALDVSGLLNHYRKEKGEKGQSRLENLEELIAAARQFRTDDEESPLLQAFLAHTALEAGETQASAFEDCIQMMTLHSAKGLEFPLVVMSGMEEGLFPHQMSMQESGRLEEERRLCYVGITRAMKKLYFTYAENRRLHGKEQYHRPSRFLREIPKQYLQEFRLKSAVSRPASIISNNSIKSSVNLDPTKSIAIGSSVYHKKFGGGIVLASEGSGNNTRLQVRFSSAGTKWLIATYLEMV